MTTLSTIYKWFPLGIHLGLSHSSLKIIEENQRGQVEMCMIDMLAMWLNESEEKHSKQVLQNALKKLKISVASTNLALPVSHSSTTAGNN